MEFLRLIKKRKRVIAWMKNKALNISFVCVLLGIGVLSLIPPRSGIELGDHDKWNHFIAYSILSLNWSFISTKSKVFWIGVCFCLLYGLLLEFLQGFVPGREPSFADALANTGGIVLGVITFFSLKARSN